MIDHHVDICAQLQNISISCSDTQFCIYMQVVFPWILLLTGSQPHDVQKSSHHRVSKRNEVTRPPSIYEKQHNWINQNWQVHTILVTHKWSNLDIRNAETKGVLLFLYVNTEMYPFRFAGFMRFIETTHPSCFLFKVWFKICKNMHIFPAEKCCSAYT